MEYKRYTHSKYNEGFNYRTDAGLYRCWSAIKSRCLNSKDAAFHNYGGRGIGFQSSWASYKNFYKEMKESYDAAKRLYDEERICLLRKDTNLGYFKENCEWGIIGAQQQNKRTNKWFIAISPDNKRYFCRNSACFERTVLKHNYTGLVRYHLKRGTSTEEGWRFEYIKFRERNYIKDEPKNMISVLQWNLRNTDRRILCWNLKTLEESL